MTNHSPGSEWLLVQGIRLTVRRVRELWAALPDAAWRSWISILTGGWILAGLFSLLLAYGGRRLSLDGRLFDERALLTHIVAAIPLDLPMAQYLGVPGDSLFLFVMVPGAALLAIWMGYLLRGLTILISLLWTDVVVGLGWLVWNRARPDLIHDGALAPSLNSFPSGHVAQAVAIYGLLAYLWIAATRSRGEQLLATLLVSVMVINVAATRLALGAHWPSDIAAGLLIGLFWLAFLIIGLRRGEQLARSAGLIAPRPAGGNPGQSIEPLPAEERLQG